MKTFCHSTYLQESTFLHTPLRKTYLFLCLMFASLLASWCLAEESTPVEEDPFALAMAAATHGPANVPMLDQATLSLPADYVFIPKAQATSLLEAMGNQPGSDLLGMVLSEDTESPWMIVARYEESGYIKDDDAKEWDADDLLQSLKDGTEAGNEVRRERGIPEFSVVGWVQSPKWEASTHRLVWSAELRDKVATEDAAAGINYNTYALGREGYISLNLVTSMNRIAEDKPVAETMLSALQFNTGKRYEDFNADTDHVAEYGLAALVGGVAAKKLGLFAVMAAFFAKFFKVIVVAAVALFAGFRKFLGGKSKSV